MLKYVFIFIGLFYDMDVNTFCFKIFNVLILLMFKIWLNFKKY